MTVIFIDNPVQDETTENPQLIDGELYHWEVKTSKIRTKRLRDELTNNRHYSDGVKYVLIYDVISVHSHFCDQGCLPGEGCKVNYSEDNHAMMLRYYLIKNK
jgi:hypothetical protein